MGLSNPSIGYAGYAPSDDILQEDINIYTETSLSFVTKITGYTLSDVQGNSIIRFKFTARNEFGGSGYHIRVYIGNNLIID